MVGHFKGVILTGPGSVSFG